MEPTARELIEQENVLDVTLLNDEENEFIFEHAGEPPHLALETENIPTEEALSDPDDRGHQYMVKRPSINVPTMQAILQRLVELEQKLEARGAEWVGIEAVRDRIRLWVDWYRAEYNRAKAAGDGGHHPSMFAYSSTGESHYGGAGADRGRVRTFFREDGSREPWALNLTAGKPERRRQNFARLTEANTPAPPETPPTPEKLTIKPDDDKGRIECPVPNCHHMETFKPSDYRTRNLAKGRMKRHCKTAKDERTAHRQVLYETTGAV